MQNHIQTLVKQFFQKERLEDVPVDELQQFTTQYPYSAVGQVLLAKKLQQAGDSQFKLQAEKSTLYFHNPVWSRWALQNNMPWAPLPLEKINIEHPEVHSVAAEPAVQENHTGYTAPVVAIPAEETPPPAGVIEVPQPGIEEPVPENERPVNGEQQHEEAPAATAEPVEEPASPPAAVEPVEEEVPFEPYHTIDYFASQGIKLKLEDLPKDKLGQQLKSFTEWLRSMKRLTPVADNTHALDALTDQAIQQIAEHSIAGKEIITEAMAEVWAKQGHKEKAIVIYEKLSLLNPSKSSYFAGKIEHLKAV